MKLLVAFFQLIRWPNLFFIALTQALFYYFILLPSFIQIGPKAYLNILEPRLFWLLSLSSVLIAAAGYIINDYFDLNIDRVNKPDRMVVERLIKRRWTIVWHWILSVFGLLIGFYISWKLRNPLIIISHLVCVTLLWFYSTTFKRKLLFGNIIVSLLTAWVILVLYLCEFRFHRFVDPVYHSLLARVYKYAILYASFAFVISLVREAIKDMEDIEGDAQAGCKTMPIVWGLNASKIFVATWIIVLIAALVVVQFYVLQFRWWWTIVYTFLLIVGPLVQLLSRLRTAITSPDFHQLSRLVKMIMLTGILSMVFFKLYTSWIG
jgi:4-hydroxybenzoate polyprenyltransferase